MVEETLVEKIHESIRALEQEGRKISLAMLVPSDPGEIEKKYSLFLSAPWLDEKSPREAIAEVTAQLREDLEDQERLAIRRITVVRSTDDLVKRINKAMKVTDRGTAFIRNCNIYGVLVDEAIVLESNRN